MSTPEIIYCQARTQAGEPCQRPASHQHVTDTGLRVHVCGTHLRMLTSRERPGSDEEKLVEWGVAPAAVPSPGQSTPLTDPAPSPPLPVDG